VVTEGAVERDYGPEGGDVGEGEGDLKFLSEEERERRRVDAFASLEGKVEQKGEDRKNKERVEELYESSEVWRDPYDVNARLRRGFREKRRVWKKEDRHKEGMQDKFSLRIEIADETDADRMRARIVEFGGAVEGEVWKPLFEEQIEEKAVEKAPKTKKLKAEAKAEKSRQSLQQALVGNTKAAIDPFLANGNGAKTKPTFGVLKRKRDTQTGDEIVTSAVTITPPKAIEISVTTPKKPGSTTALVGYDSD
jgi:coiled-coil domain-containing protein 130